MAAGAVTVRVTVPMTDSTRVPLDGRLVLRWAANHRTAAVIRAGRAIGVVYDVRRWGLDGWCNSWSERVYVTAALAANALLPGTDSE